MYFNFIEYERVIIIKLNLELATKPKAVNFKNFVLKLLSRNKNIVIDFSSIIFIDTTFLGALIIGLKEAKSKGLNVDLVMPNLDVPIWNLQIIDKISSLAKIYTKMENINFHQRVQSNSINNRSKVI